MLKSCECWALLSVLYVNEINSFSFCSCLWLVLLPSPFQKRTQT